MSFKQRDKHDMQAEKYGTYIPDLNPNSLNMTSVYHIFLFAWEHVE